MDYQDQLATRGYIPHFKVQYKGFQKDRFGPENRDEIRTMLETNDIDEYPPDFNGEWPDFPRVARLRMNLTALSQRYDLYFVAYRGYVHVSKPNRTSQGILDKSPLAILDPNDSATPMAAFVPGHVNRGCPHEVNQLIVGDLGDMEIVLLCRDNGDVVAWRTQDIARLAEKQLTLIKNPEEKIAPARPRHFFADSVGLSAWGLAIHSKTRLIAVSANTSEVTIFAFALHNPDDNEEDEETDDDTDEDESSEEVVTPTRPSKSRGKFQNFSFPVKGGQNKSKQSQLPPQTVGATGFPSSATLVVPPLRSREERREAITKLEAKLRKRDRPWRIIIPFGVEASNLPNVVFCEDKMGNADRVAAIDINGNIFIGEIWNIGTKPIKIPPHNVQDLTGHFINRNTGWSLLALTDTQLRPTKTLRSAIGMSPPDTIYRGRRGKTLTWLDISKGMSDVPRDSARRHHLERYTSFDRVDHSSPPDDNTLEQGQILSEVHVSEQVFFPQFPANVKLDVGGGRPVRIGMTIVPVTGDHYGEFRSPQELVEFASGHACTNRALRMPKVLTIEGYRFLHFRDGDDPDSRRLLRGISFLRAYEDCAEVVSVENHEEGAGLICNDMLPSINFGRQPTFWDMRYGARCSMLLTIPQLSLVILGSMCGRVALLTLTKPPLTDPPNRMRPKRAFRVEAVLPFDSEDKKRDRPYVCLLGIAVSPVPETSAQGLELRKRRSAAYGGRKYRETMPELEPAAPTRWRLILNYMDHTVLQYDIVKGGHRRGAKKLAQRVRSKKNKRSRRRWKQQQQPKDSDSSPSSTYDSDPRVKPECEDPEFAYFSEYDPTMPVEKGNSLLQSPPVSEDDSDVSGEAEIPHSWPPATAAPDWTGYQNMMQQMQTPGQAPTQPVLWSQFQAAVDLQITSHHQNQQSDDENIADDEGEEDSSEDDDEEEDEEDEGGYGGVDAEEFDFESTFDDN